MKLYLIIILLLLIILLLFLNKTNNYEKFTSDNPPCNIGPPNSNPSPTCQNVISNYERAPLKNITNEPIHPEIINVEGIDAPTKSACSMGVNSMSVNSIGVGNKLTFNYYYLISPTFQGTVAFDVIGNKSYVYLDMNTNIETQKWKIRIMTPTNSRTCLVQFYSWSNQHPSYYLTAHQDGNVGVSLFGDGNEQIWELEYLDTEKVLIKSQLYCTYLTTNNNGYIKKNTGQLALSPNKEGQEKIWILRGYGKSSIPTTTTTTTTTTATTYTPSRSATDFPYSGDYLNQSVLPEGVKISKDAVWKGRNVWMPEFISIWNQTFTATPTGLITKIPKKIGTFPIAKKTINDFLSKQYQSWNQELQNLEKMNNGFDGDIIKRIIQLKNLMNQEMISAKTMFETYKTQPEYLYAGKDQYQIIEQSISLTLNLVVNLKPNSESQYLNASGDVNVDVLTSQSLTLPLPTSGIIQAVKGGEWRTNYDTVKYGKETRKITGVKSYGANILQNDNIFIEMLPKKGKEIRVKVMLKDKDGKNKYEIFKLD